MNYFTSCGLSDFLFDLDLGIESNGIIVTTHNTFFNIFITFASYFLSFSRLSKTFL